MRAGQLVEVCGVGGSGKTEILMQAAVNCALPRERDGVRFGGCESSVLLLDLDGKFDTLRLLKILTARVEAALARETRDARTNAPMPGLEGVLRKGPDGDKEADDALVRLSDSVYRESVGRFQMVRCHNSLDFLKALAVVDKIFERREALAATRAAAETDAETVTKKRAAAPAAPAARGQRGCVLLAGPRVPARSRRAAQSAQRAPRLRARADGDLAPVPRARGGDQSRRRDQSDVRVGSLRRETGTLRRVDRA